MLKILYRQRLAFVGFHQQQRQLFLLEEGQDVANVAVALQMVIAVKVSTIEKPCAPRANSLRAPLIDMFSR
nr:hypothetical protein [Pseudomonas sp. BIGb0427]